MADQILKRLRFSTADREAIVSMVQSYDLQGCPRDAPFHPETIAGAPDLRGGAGLHRADCLGCHGNLANVHFLRRKQRELQAEILPRVS